MRVWWAASVCGVRAVRAVCGVCAVCGLLVVVLILPVLAGCAASSGEQTGATTARIRFGEPHVAVLRGNYAFSRGQFSVAMMRYLRAADTDRFRPFVDYNLANSYYAVGEFDSALRLWRQVATAEEPAGLAAAAAFNMGVQYYELAQYDAAFAAFRQVLRLDPANMPAKVNLELTERRLSGGQPAQRRADNDSAVGDGPLSPQSMRVLEFVRRQEEQRWEAPRQVVPPEPVDDW